MKNILKIFIAIMLALCLCMPAMAETAAMIGKADESVCDVNYVGDMVVVNCDEWVSLRSAANTSSTRLAKVPLGATVTDCVISNEDSGFVSCYYNGQLGYVLRDYLAPVKEEAPFEPIYVGDMVVIDCEEWVSLRNAPSTSSPRILQVPLGAKVTDCLVISDEFIYCRYGGYSGYILTEYLSANATSGAAMSRNELLNFGREMFNVSYNGYNVISCMDYYGEGELLKTVCYGPDGNAVWSHDSMTGYSTELDLTDAFPGGTSEMPLIMIYNAEIGLSALDLYTGEEQWLLSCHDIDLGGSISTATDGLGNMYIGGFYGPDPVAIDMYGTILWQAKPSVEAYWMHEIILTEAGVTAIYDCLGEHEQSGEICYDYGTGEEVGKQWY